MTTIPDVNKIPLEYHLPTCYLVVPPGEGYVKACNCLMTEKDHYAAVLTERAKAVTGPADAYLKELLRDYQAHNVEKVEANAALRGMLAEPPKELGQWRAEAFDEATKAVSAEVQQKIKDLEQRCDMLKKKTNDVTAEAMRVHCMSVASRINSLINVSTPADSTSDMLTAFQLLALSIAKGD
jgi:hypothetical protein